LTGKGKSAGADLYRVAPMRLRAVLILSLAAALALIVPAGAAADFQTLYDDYRTDGVIDGCSYSSSELSAGLSDIPADVREYDPGFSDALNAALEQVAAGCGVSPQASAAKNQASAADGSPGPVAPKPVAFNDSGAGRGLPALLMAMIVFGAATLAAAALLLGSHYYGWDLRGRLAPVGGAARGAESRIAEAWRSLRDRLGF
jgi:hypothetical protein